MNSVSRLRCCRRRRNFISRYVSLKRPTLPAGDKIEVLSADAEEEWWEGKVARTGQTGSFQILFTQGWEGTFFSLNSSLPAINAKAKPMSSNNIKRAQSKRVSASPTHAKAKALYDYTASCDGELSLKEGETITVLNKNTGSPDWWEGEGRSGRGQFPSTYVQLLSEESSSTSTGQSKSGIRAKAIYDYTATGPDELSIAEGDVINVTDATDPDWWKGEVGARSGTFPATYVEKI